MQWSNVCGVDLFYRFAGIVFKTVHRVHREASAYLCRYWDFNHDCIQTAYGVILMMIEAELVLFGVIWGVV